MAAEARAEGGVSCTCAHHQELAAAAAREAALVTALRSLRKAAIYEAQQGDGISDEMAPAIDAADAALAQESPAASALLAEVEALRGVERAVRALLTTDLDKRAAAWGVYAALDTVDAARRKP